MAVIDVHSHILTDELIGALAGSGMRHRLACEREPDGRLMLTFDGTPKLGPIPEGIRNVATRLRDMDRLCVRAQRGDAAAQPDGCRGRPVSGGRKANA